MTAYSEHDLTDTEKLAIIQEFREETIADDLKGNFKIENSTGDRVYRKIHQKI